MNSYSAQQLNKLFFTIAQHCNSTFYNSLINRTAIFPVIHGLSVCNYPLLSGASIRINYVSPHCHLPATDMLSITRSGCSLICPATRTQLSGRDMPQLDHPLWIYPLHTIGQVNTWEYIACRLITRRIGGLHSHNKRRRPRRCQQQHPPSIKDDQWTVLNEDRERDEL